MKKTKKRVRYTLDPQPDVWTAGHIIWEQPRYLDVPDDMKESQVVEQAWAVSLQERGGNPDALRRYFTKDEDGDINWGSKGSFKRCVAKASKHMTDEQAKGFCNLRHKEATGKYPGEKRSSHKERMNDEDHFYGAWNTGGAGGRGAPMTASQQKAAAQKAKTQQAQKLSKEDEDLALRLADVQARVFIARAALQRLPRWAGNRERQEDHLNQMQAELRDLLAKASKKPGVGARAWEEVQTLKAAEDKLDDAWADISAPKTKKSRRTGSGWV